MQTKRRGFFKTIGGIVGAALVGERVKTEPLPPYERKFKENAIEVKGPFHFSGLSGSYYLTGVYPNTSHLHVSGLLNIPKK